MARLTLSKKVAFTAMIVTGVWLLGEAAVTRFYPAELRAWQSPAPSSKEASTVLHGNPYLIYEFPPGRHIEGGVPVSINSLGLRGPELTIPKPPGMRRFITTGDSSVFGFGVKDDQVFSTVAEARLKTASPDAQVQAVCGAVPGYSTFGSINLLRLRALSTEPDLFVLGNIWSDNNFDSFVDKELLATYSGYEESLTGNALRLLSRSAVFRVADWKLRVRKRQQAIQARYREVSGNLLGRGDQIGLRRVEINDYAANLETLVRMARARGAEVAFLLLANNEDLIPATGGAMEPPKAWDPYRTVMRDTAARHGAPILEIPDLFRASGLSRKELFLDEMHPTPAGHRMMGEALAGLLENAHWAEGGSVMGEPAGGSIPQYTDPFVVGADGTSGGGSPGAVGDAAQGGGVLSGQIVCNAYKKGRIQIDVMAVGSNSPTVVNSVLATGPGEFRVVAGAAEHVVLRAYLDEDEDGPDGDDRMIDLTGTVIDVEGQALSGIVLDLDRGTVEQP